jgi:hypothetical protein
LARLQRPAAQFRPIPHYVRSIVTLARKQRSEISNRKNQSFFNVRSALRAKAANDYHWRSK